MIRSWLNKNIQKSRTVTRGMRQIPYIADSALCMNCFKNFHVTTTKRGYGCYRSSLREIRAFSQLLSRSVLSPNPRVLISSSHFWGQRHTFSTSCRNQQQKDEDKDEEKKEEDEKQMSPLPLLTTVLFFGLALWTTLQMSKNDQHYITWNDFYHNMLLKGEVRNVTIYKGLRFAVVRLYDDSLINGQKPLKSSFVVKMPDINQFEVKLKKVEDELDIPIDKRIPVHYIDPSPTLFQILAVLGGVVIVYFMWKGRSKMNFPKMMDEIFKDERKAKFLLVDNMTAQGKGVTFKDVAGLKEAKVEVMEFVDYLKNPLRYQELGAKIPRGALLLGPPGCGKTLLAKAVATESKVPFLAMAGPEFIEMIGGLGSSRVRDLFAEARKRSPCIVYIDELDAIGKKRGNGSNGEEDQTLNQLLVEMDGMGTREGVIMLASTNRADILDMALLRPGRFDRHITIDLPTRVEREELFEMYLKNLILQQKPESYSRSLSHMTPGMTGADIANICNEAAIHAARETKKVIDTQDLEYAVERTVAGVEKKSRLLSPSEKKICAYHEMGHALTGWQLEHTDALLKVSIIPRTNSALGFAQYIPSDLKLYSTEQLFERMCTALGGRAAEAIIFNHVTTGAEDDLKRVTNLAYSQIRTYGMNERVGYLSFPSAEETGRRPFSKRLAHVMDEEARTLVNKAYRTSERILQENKDKLHLLAENLLDKEVLTYEDIAKLIGPPPHGDKNKIPPIGWSDGVGVDLNGETEPKKPRKRKQKEDS